MQNRGIYIHIPFCNKICSYCDFAKLYNISKYEDEYIDELIKDINNLPEDKYNSIYIGGGTPSVLKKDNLIKLLSSINEYTPVKEYTFECNIEDINEELLQILKDNHINRLSIGVQSFNKKILSYLNRNTDINIKDKIKLAKKYFNNINIDLIYAIKDESLDDLEIDLNKFIDLDIPHISCYSLIIEPNTVLNNMNIKPIDEELDYKMYKLIEETLEENGYNHYEISNYAKSGYESVHNTSYWNNEEYYGLGLGASGYIDNIRYDNTRSINYYLNGKRHIYEEELSKDNIMDYEMILGLRKLKGINKNDFYNKYQVNIKDIYNIDDLKDKGLIEEDKDYIRIPKDKVYISNSVLVNFIRDNE